MAYLAYFVAAFVAQANFQITSQSKIESWYIKQKNQIIISWTPPSTAIKSIELIPTASEGGQCKTLTPFPLLDLGKMKPGVFELDPKVIGWLVGSTHRK